MEILVDTNVFLDIILNRSGSQTARRFFVAATQQSHNIFISASSATDIFYIVKKNGGMDKAYQALSFILGLVSVMSVTERDIIDAYSAHWLDFEDCVQYKTAQNNYVDILITNNTSDFEEHGLPVMTPDDYVKQSASTLE